MEKTIRILIKQMKALNATNVHFTAENVFETQNLTSVLSVYDSIKPAHMVLDELSEWAERKRQGIIWGNPTTATWHAVESKNELKNY